jgi:site-specific recombinase XerC
MSETLKPIAIMAVLSLKILPTRQKSSGKLEVYVCLTHRKSQRYINTGIEIDDEFQFEKGVVCYRKDARIMNQRLAYILDIYSERLERINTNKYSNCADLKEALMTEEEKKESMTVSGLFEWRIKMLEEEGRTSYIKMNTYSCKVIVSIIGDVVIDYLTKRDITTLLRAMQRRGYSNGNIQMRMTHFKAALNLAINNDYVKYDEHPFKGFTMPQSEPRLMDITPNQLNKIINIQSDNKRLSLARDIFLLSFYLGGINLADLVRADLSGSVLSYSRLKSDKHKTGCKTTAITIQPEARAIINKYISIDGRLNLGFGESEYASIQRYIGKALKCLAEAANIKTDFSYYSARKTFAQLGFMLNIKTEVIEYCIGQSMKTNRPIYNYVRVMQKQADSAIRKVIDYAFHPEQFDV